MLNIRQLLYDQQYGSLAGNPLQVQSYHADNDDKSA